MKNTTISSSLEDYLEAIAEIIEEQGHAHTKEIADHLKVKMPSVTNALQALSARGLIHYQSHSPVFLTPAGEKVMSRIVLLSEAIAVREDCAELRAYLNQTLPQLNSETSEQEQLISLDQLPVGARGVVVKVAENLRGIKKFADLGLVSGTLLEMEGTAPLGDLMRIKVMGSSLSLRKSDATHIWLRPAE